MAITQHMSTDDFNDWERVFDEEGTSSGEKPQDRPRFEHTNPFYNTRRLLGELLDETGGKVIPFPTPITQRPQQDLPPTEAKESRSSNPRISVPHLRAKTPPHTVPMRADSNSVPPTQTESDSGPRSAVPSRPPSIAPGSGVQVIHSQFVPPKVDWSQLPSKIREHFSPDTEALLADEPTRRSTAAELAPHIKIAATRDTVGFDEAKPLKPEDDTPLLSDGDDDSIDPSILAAESLANDDLELHLSQHSQHPPLPLDPQVSTMGGFFLPREVLDSVPSIHPRAVQTETLVDVWEEGSFAAPLPIRQPSIIPALHAELGAMLPPLSQPPTNSEMLVKRNISSAPHANIVGTELDITDPDASAWANTDPQQLLGAEVQQSTETQQLIPPIPPVSSNPEYTIDELPPSSYTASFVPSVAKYPPLNTHKSIERKGYINQIFNLASSARAKISSFFPKKPSKPSTVDQQKQFFTKRTAGVFALATAALSLIAISHRTPKPHIENTNHTSPTALVANPTNTTIVRHTVETPIQTRTQNTIESRTSSYTGHQTIYLQGSPSIPDTFLSALYGYMHGPNVAGVSGYHYQTDQATHMFARLLREQPQLRRVLGGNMKGCSFTFATDTATGEVVLVQAYSPFHTRLLKAPVRVGSLI